MFTSSPQSGEVHQAGTWWAGELLGWRHDASGPCQMWVRVIVGGVEEAAWIDLAALRLPGQHVPLASEPGRTDFRVKQELPTAQAISALRGKAVGGVAISTAALPLIDNETVAAPSLPAARPSTSAHAQRPGGRRRAPEEAGVQVALDVPVPAGRHRADGDGDGDGDGDDGRHRAADTEAFTAVTDETDRFAAVPAETPPATESRRAARQNTGAGWSVPSARAARAEESYGRTEVCTGRIDVELDLLTRPMRLGDLSSKSRRPRVGGSRSGI